MKSLFILILSISMFCFGCKKYDSIDDLNNIFDDENFKALSLVDIEYSNGQLINTRNGKMILDNKYDEFSQPLKNKISRILIYKNGVLLNYTLSPDATEYTRSGSVGTSVCMEFAFASVAPLEISKRSEKMCFGF